MRIDLRCKQLRPAGHGSRPAARHTCSSSVFRYGGMPVLFSTDRSDARSINSTASTVVSFSTRHGLTCRRDVRKDHQRTGLMRMLRHGVVRDLCDEPERPFGSDHEVLDDVERIGEVHQGIQTVPGGVLHFELVTDPFGEHVGSRARARPERATRSTIGACAT